MNPAPPIRSGVRAVFFDAVGTLIHPDPPPARVYAAIGRRFGSRRQPEAIGRRFASAFQREEVLDRENGLRTSEARESERWRRIVAAVLDDVADADACFRELYLHFSRPEAWRCAAETALVLRTLADRGLVLGLASNYDSRLRSVCAGLPELAPLAHMVISSEIGWRKPSAEFFAALIRACACRPDEILVVGDDSINDVAGGRAAGLRAVLLDPRGTAPATQGERIGQLSELLRVLE